jgi:hypothetical protein
MTTLDVVTAAALTRRPIREAVEYAAHVLRRRPCRQGIPDAGDAVATGQEVA